MKLKQLIAFAFLLSTQLTMQNSAMAATLYKWVGADGKIAYQDYPPTEGQSFEEKILQAPASGSKIDKQRAIAEAAEEAPINFYTASNCDACKLTQNILERNVQPFEIINVENDAKVQAALLELTDELKSARRNHR
ncbi:MAG: hypothetical protein ACI9J2_001525 [Saprospiraceae bacterium]|jgi:hypothetical protein